MDISIKFDKTENSVFKSFFYLILFFIAWFTFEIIFDMNFLYDTRISAKILFLVSLVYVLYYSMLFAWGTWQALEAKWNKIEILRTTIIVVTWLGILLNKQNHLEGMTELGLVVLFYFILNIVNLSKPKKKLEPDESSPINGNKAFFEIFFPITCLTFFMVFSSWGPYLLFRSKSFLSYLVAGSLVTIICIWYFLISHSFALAVKRNNANIIVYILATVQFLIGITTGIHFFLMQMNHPPAYLTVEVSFFVLISIWYILISRKRK